MVRMRTFRQFYIEKINASEISRQIANVNPALVAKGSKRGAALVQPTGEYNKEEFPNDLKKAGFEVTNVVPPKSGPLSKSGSLDTYYAKDEQGNEIAIVLGQGAGGIGSKGIAFEKQLEQDLINYTKGVTEFTHAELIESIIKEFDLKPDNFEVIPEGGMNKPRPLKFSEAGPYIDFSGDTIAATLTDLTLDKQGEKIYLSLKHGATVTFFNSGITKILSEKEITQGKIENELGSSLLETFGIDNEIFCRVFNEYGETNFSEYNKQVTDYDKDKLFNLLSSGIGDGYYMVHQLGKKFKFTNIDENYNKSASNVTTPLSVFYGGAKGNGKRIDIVFESDVYKFKVNIRNKQGGLYPSHIMCDYKAK